MSKAKRAEGYRPGAAKGADDRARRRSISDWSTDEASFVEGWGVAGWRGYWDAHSGADVDLDAEAQMGWGKQTATAALGLGVAAAVLLREKLRRPRA
jgi:hypothetical protein